MRAGGCFFAGLRIPGARHSSSETAEGSPLLASVGRSLSGTSAETRQLLRRLSARVGTRLLSGYRSLSMGSDDVDRHEYGASTAAFSLLLYCRTAGGCYMHLKPRFKMGQRVLSGSWGIFYCPE